MLCDSRTAKQTFAEMQLGARSVTDIAYWVARHSHEAMESSRFKSMIRRFVQPMSMSTVDITNAGYCRYFPGMGVETASQMLNMLGYSAELVFGLRRDTPQRVDVNYYPGVYINGHKPTGNPGKIYTQHIFMPAAEWPFITAHMVFDWLHSAVSYQVMPSEKYATHYLGLDTLKHLFYNKVLDRESLEPIINGLHRTSFPQLPWKTLIDMHEAGVLPESKNEFTDWLCSTLLTSGCNQQLSILPDNVSFT